MSNEKKVWIGTLEDEDNLVNIYFCRPNYPGIYDYQEHARLMSEREKDPKNKKLKNKESMLFEISYKITTNYRHFKKLEVLPDGLWFEKSTKKLPKKNDYIFKITNGHLMLDECSAEIFKQFQLGQTTLSPLKIHKLFTDELWNENTYYFLNLCECRHFVAEIQTNKNIKFHDYLVTPSFDKNYLKDNELEINQVALECNLDFWHDPLYSDSYFFSDRLYRALVEAGLDKKWDMHFCKLV